MGLLYMYQQNYYVNGPKGLKGLKGPKGIDDIKIKDYKDVNKRSY